MRIMVNDALTMPSIIVNYKNCKIFYPHDPDDIDEMYNCFRREFCHFFIPKSRRINFTSSEFDAFNIMCRLSDKTDILQMAHDLGLNNEKYYHELIDNEYYANCGFLHIIYILYNIKKYQYGIVSIDLPETGLHPLIVPRLISTIMSITEQVNIFTFHSLFLQCIGEKVI